MKEPLAHSARGNRGAQTWRSHAQGVADRAQRAARRLEGIAGSGLGLALHVEAAARYHDLGKLDEENQRVLGGTSQERLPHDHVDAGVAHLLNRDFLQAAVLAHAHHGGLCSFPAEAVKGEGFLRNQEEIERTNRSLARWTSAAMALLGQGDGPGPGHPRWDDGLTWRLALSCLVDGDHGDTACHYSGESEQPPLPRWSERRAALDRHVANLAIQSAGSPRGAIRQEIYRACRDASLSPSLRACDSPVGSGKTTAVMAHLLRVAEEQDLSHVFVVLPYTNIITQSVREYRAALVLPGEDPEAVVAEHHHRVDLARPELRALSALWRSPIVVTTAVQFFEALGSHHPGRLRKLHELPASAVFVDEAHAAIPAALWPLTWQWIVRLSERWRCHFVFGSGSLVRFWNIPEVARLPTDLPDIVPEALRLRAAGAETRRVRYRRLEGGLGRGEILQEVARREGPRLVVVNTVQTAAVLADELRNQGGQVLHLSTALCPRNRDAIVDRVRQRLGDHHQDDWTLVATSCVEAGLDFSFRTAFRETASTASLIQIGGRVNRHGERDEGEVWDFSLFADGLVSRHPGLETSREVLDALFRENRIGAGVPSEAATEAMRREILSNPQGISERLKELEGARDFPGVDRLYRVIDADTRLVVVERELAERLREGCHVGRRDLLAGSVQIWSSKIRKLGLVPVSEASDDDEDALYLWPHAYDPDFLGYMAGLLPILRKEPMDGLAV